MTICTQHREYFFGDVVHGEMVMSKIGKIARDCWMEIPNHFPFVKLDGFVVMPNHVHGIIVIDKMDDGNRTDAIIHNRTDAINRVSTTDTNNADDGNRTDAINRVSTTDTNNADDGNRTDAINRVSTTNNADMEKSIGGVTGNHNSMLHENLSRIIRWFKGRTSFESRKISAEFAWQARFHDHIIRSEKSYQTISEYIINNRQNVLIVF